MKIYFKALSLFALCGCSIGSLRAQVKPDTLLKNFLSPPNSAKPRVWWHWMNGNITKDGIKKDLLWMKRSGIGGFQNFDAAMVTPQIVAKRLVYMTPEWKDAFHFTTKLADSLHLEMAIAGSPGWSESGGPWVSAADGMKKYVWTETLVEGGKAFNGTLPKPPSTSGEFGNLVSQDMMSLGMETKVPPTYYHDISVIAYKLPEADIPMTKLSPIITTSSGGTFDVKQLSDGDVGTAPLLPSDSVKGYAWIQFAFDKPTTIKAITIVGGGVKGPFGLFGPSADSRKLLVSDDGQNFRQVCLIPPGNIAQQTLNIPATTAKYYRITIKNPVAPPDLGAMFGMGGGAPPKKPLGTPIAELVLHTVTQINRFEEKAGFSPAVENNIDATPDTKDVIALADVVDLTQKVTADGALQWTPPAGNWKIIRFGYSLTGITNHPATAEATGLEVDKLDPVAVRAYFEHYLDMYKDATSGLMGQKGGLQYMVTDSWEAGAANWTKNLMAEFAKKRGYSMIPWMPVLTGHIINSTRESEQFLWDFRKTLGELLAENHYDQLTNILHERGMKRYSESHEDGRALIGDGMEMKRRADIPMSAMWTPSMMGDGYKYQSDIRESASVAHIYGQNIVAAESLTAFGPGGNAWSYYPENLKPTADMELASGLNRFVIHTSVHQPTDDKLPGLGLGPFGQWFNRHDTWAEQAKAWTAYLSRSSYMLQQGKFVADIIYYYGEDNNITALFGKKLPNIPDGYAYDFVNADALLNRLSVSNGQIVTPSGMQYKVLALDSNSRQMSLKVLNKIADLVRNGATVVGPKPIGSPGLKDDEKIYNAVANDLWESGTAMVTYGKGKVFPSQTLAEALNTVQITPDFKYTKPASFTKLLYVHRKLAQEDIYWINNRSDSVQNLDATFRVAGRAVQIWHPETGKSEVAGYSFNGGNTTVPLQLQPNDAVFVIFKGDTKIASKVLPQHKETQVALLDGPWNVTFQKDRGAPEKATLNNLASWSENTDEGIKFFSGTGVYTKQITATADLLKKGKEVWLDLGNVKNLAEVSVNGKDLGIVWKKPYRVNLTGQLQPGTNTLTIKVTNLWVNRLIGDAQTGTTKKISYTTMPFYQANAKLAPSGLLGPVRLVSVE